MVILGRSHAGDDDSFFRLLRSYREDSLPDPDNFIYAKHPGLDHGERKILPNLGNGMDRVWIFFAAIGPGHLSETL